MKKFLLFAFLVFLVAGCAEDTTKPTDGQTSQEQLNKVDDAFTNEFKKYVTDETGSAAYTGTFSSQAETNIKSLLQNITGRGGMPAASGIGEVANEEIATAIAKIIAENSVSAEVLKYSILSQPTNSFLQSVMQIFMSGSGSTLITTLKRVNNNSQSIITLSDSLQSALNATNISANARANIVYLNSSLIGYLNNSSTGIQGIKNEYVLPNNKAMLDEIAQAFIDQGEYSSNIVNYDKPTPEFKVMPILANGGSMPSALPTMMALMAKLTGIFEKYGYAESSSSGNQDEEAITTSGMDEMIFPSMILSGLTGYEQATATQKSKNRALEFYKALITAGGTKLATFNPALDAAYANTSIVPVIITELQNSGVNNYSDFNTDSSSFTTNVVSKFFNDTAPTAAGTTLIENYNNAAANLPSAQSN